MGDGAITAGEGLFDLLLLTNWLLEITVLSLLTGDVGADLSGKAIGWAIASGKVFGPLWIGKARGVKGCGTPVSATALLHAQSVSIPTIIHEASRMC